VQIFAPTATGMVDSQAFLRRYLRNLALEQLPDGRVPPIVPAAALGTGWPYALLGGLYANSTGWGDASVRVPWTLYWYYGDRTALERQYDSMRAWVDYLARRAPERGLVRLARREHAGESEPFVLDSGFQWGEWQRPGQSDDPFNMLEGTLHGDVVATAYFASSARLLASTAAVLGREADARRYERLADQVRAAWQAAFLGADGHVGTDRQDDYVRALAFDLLPPGWRAVAAGRLVELIEQGGGHLGTGFLSTPMLLQVLVDSGHADVAFRLLLQTTPPSWLYQVEHGATTVWESWEGSESQNHYALGSVAAWLREQLAGISPLEPGYRAIRIAPVVGGGLTWADASVETPFGSARSRWWIEGPDGFLEVTIPPGTRGAIELPDGRSEAAGPGVHRFRWSVR
ncbi:MAG TPA: alpha-L-rhamnosidase C-terminal domain-containing protein, partial [Myxococcales bacterium]|nr:alpha-L-rhamnosidase C-terminal domain-containing protein [Myxococcales bacterium]